MTIATSKMEPFRILFDGFQPLALTDRGVTGGFFLSVAGVVDRHPNFIVYLIVRFYLRMISECIYLYIDFIYIYLYRLVSSAGRTKGRNVNFFLFSRLNGSAGRRRAEM